MFLKSFLTKFVCNIYLHRNRLKINLHNYLFEILHKRNQFMLIKVQIAEKGTFRHTFPNFVLENVLGKIALCIPGQKSENLHWVTD